MVRTLYSIAAVTISMLIASINAHAQLSGVKLVDLSHTYDETTLFWPTSPIKFDHPEISYGQTENGYFYSAYTFAAPEHGGTHLDAPIHFFEGGKTVEAIDVNDLFLPVNVIDISDRAASDRNYLLQASDVAAFEKQHGMIQKGTAVLIRTDWSNHWPNAKAYMGDDTPGDTSKLSFPSIGVEAAKLLVERGAKLIGIDTASTDAAQSTTFDVHVVIASAGIPALENLTGLAALPAKGAHVMALPMKIGKGSGGPARVVGMLPN